MIAIDGIWGPIFSEADVLLQKKDKYPGPKGQNLGYGSWGPGNSTSLSSRVVGAALTKIEFGTFKPKNLASGIAMALY